MYAPFFAVLEEAGGGGVYRGGPAYDVTTFEYLPGYCLSPGVVCSFSARRSRRSPRQARTILTEKWLALIDDTKWRINDLFQIISAEFWNGTPNVGLILQAFDACDHFSDKAGADIRGALLSVPGANVLKIDQCRLGDPNFHDTGQERPSRILASPRDTSRPSLKSDRPVAIARLKARSTSTSLVSLPSAVDLGKCLQLPLAL